MNLWPYFYIVIIGISSVRIVGGDVNGSDNNMELVINGIVDKVIEAIRKSLNSNNGGTVDIPDINVQKNKGIETGIVGTNGQFRDLSSLTRTGDVKLIFKQDSIAVDVQLGLSKIEFHYKPFEAWYGLITLKDEVTVTVGKNSIQVKLSMKKLNDHLNITLDSVQLVALDIPIITRRRNGIVKTASNNMVNWLVSWWQQEIKVTLEELLRNALTEQLDKHCKLL